MVNYSVKTTEMDCWCDKDGAVHLRESNNYLTPLMMATIAVVAGFFVYKYWCSDCEHKGKK